MSFLSSASTVTSTFKLEPEFRRHPSSISSDKNVSISYQKSQTIPPLYEKSELTKPLDVDEALSLLKESTEVESSYYIPILRQCIVNNSVSVVQTVHAHIIKTGTYKDLLVTTFLMNAYAKCEAIRDARRVFDYMPRRNVVAWTTMITGYVSNSQPDLALCTFLDMLEAGVYPTNFTLGIILNACSSMNSLKLGKELHGYIIKYQIDYDTSIGNSLCCLYSKFGNMDSAVQAFKAIKEKNVISWTAAISAYGDNGDVAMGMKLFIEMLYEGVQPNEYTVTTIFSLCCTMLSFGIGTQIHALSIKLGFTSNTLIKNSIMYLYLKCGNVDEAHKLFTNIEAASLVTWNSMIAGLTQMIDMTNDDISAYENGNKALDIFLKLNRSDMKPDLYTLSSILTVCNRLAALEQGEQVHSMALKSGYLSDVVVGTSLVNMYTKCGSIEKATKAFLEMSNRTLISWTTMINGFAQHGQTQQALQLFEDMRIAGVRPNKVTFVGVLYACSYAGMVNEAFGYFESMQKDYKLKPVMDHYTCLIEMYARLGRLDDAFGIIKKMEIEPHEIIWSNLITGCRSHGNTELALYAAEQLLKFKPKHTETYVLLLSLYTSAERWKDVSHVKKLMEEEKIRGLKDLSWIIMKGKMYSFEPNDRSHICSVEMYKLLEELFEKAKISGYEPSESRDICDHDINDQEKEEDEDNASAFTVYHSEKLAIAFALLNTPSAAEMVVNKSIGMSGDCHSFIKVVSSLTNRKIVVRDSRRLHKFVNGQCSCLDFGIIFPELAVSK
ncbi:hypothetical protein ACFE04_004844 [Oxalis oulophora]